MFVVGRDSAHAFATESRSVVHDFHDARVFLDDRPAFVSPATLRLQFREAGWKRGVTDSATKVRHCVSVTTPTGVVCPR